MDWQPTTCPACGGRVHPVAGRCKHCKADIAGARNSAAAAGDAVAVTAQPATRSAPTGAPALQAPAQPIAAPPPAQPIAARPPPTRTWPLILGGLALLAIGMSLGLLIARRGGGTHAGRLATPAAFRGAPRPVSDQAQAQARLLAPKWHI